MLDLGLFNSSFLNGLNVRKCTINFRDQSGFLTKTGEDRHH